MNNIHFKAQSGWINDPNGLCFFKGQYHLFYQYFPYDLKWGTMHWGHATTTDFITYQHHPIALFPSIIEDQNGVFSGSAFIEDDQMNLFFTGVKYNDFAADIHRYGQQLFISNQLKISSQDGFKFDNFKGKQVVIPKLERPAGDPIHTRDPKVWKNGDKYYLVLGSNVIVDNRQQGALLFFESNNLIDFKPICTFTKPEMGHMWECPDYFEIADQGFVVMSPEGTMPESQYPSHVYIASADFDYSHSLELQSELQLLDIGLDCYAPQTFEDENGSRVLISWVRMPEKIEEHSIGVFTMAREIRYLDNQLSYCVHSLIESQFKPSAALSKLDSELTYKINCKLAPGQFLKIGNYSISNKNSCIHFDRSQLFPLDDKNLKQIQSSSYNGAIELAIYYDGYIVETFINSGLEVCTHVLYGNAELTIETNTNYQVFELKGEQ